MCIDCEEAMYFWPTCLPKGPPRSTSRRQAALPPTHSWFWALPWARPTDKRSRKPNCGALQCTTAGTREGHLKLSRDLTGQERGPFQLGPGATWIRKGKGWYAGLRIHNLVCTFRAEDVRGGQSYPWASPIQDCLSMLLLARTEMGRQHPDLCSWPCGATVYCFAQTTKRGYTKLAR